MSNGELKPGDVFNPWRMFVGVFISNAMISNPLLSSTAKLCYGQLCQHAGEKGRCFPSYKKLSEELGRSEKQIFRVIQELEDNGFILGKQPEGEDRLKHLNKEYFFLWHKSFVQTVDQGKSGLDVNGYSGLDLNGESYIKESLIKESCKDKESFPSEKNPLSIMVSVSETNIPVLKKRVIPLFEKTTRHHYRKDVLEIISYWNNSPGLTKHRIPTGESSPTKTFLTIVRSIGKVLDGSFFISAGMPDKNRVYTKEEIILAIDRFKLISTNLSYLPANKSWFSGFGLSVFFFNPYSKSVPSQFLQCLENEPKLIVSSVPIQPDNNPQLTKWLKEAYVNKVLLGQTRKFSPIEENKFIVGANQLHSTIRVLQLKLNMMTRPIEWCYLVIESLVDQWKDKEIVPGHIASEYTYVETLPRYLKKKGRIG